MAVVNVAEHGVAVQIRKKIIAPSAYGVRRYGVFHYGAGGKTHGIYQVRTRFNHQVVVQEKFYVPTNPKTEIQQANRQKMTDAVSTWQALTNSQKEVYNKRAGYNPYSGYNLYLKEYLLSH